MLNCESDRFLTIIKPSTSIGATSTNPLSAGSAAFIVIAMILGLLSQGSGCLFLQKLHSPWWQVADFRKRAPNELYSTSGALPLWRLSPFLCALETGLILTHLFRAPFRKMSHKTVCYELIHARTQALGEPHQHQDEEAIFRKPKVEIAIPMFLQIWKAVFLQGAPFTQIISVLYWTNWAIVEYIYFIVWLHRAALEKKEVSTIAGGSRRFWTRYTIYLALLLPYGIICYAYSRRPEVERSAALLVLGILAFCVVSGLLPAAVLHGYNPLQPMVLCTFLLGLVYYSAFYRSGGTCKPSWLDWFG